MSNGAPILGVWRLESFRFDSLDGTPAYDQWPDPAGLLIYTPDGFMSMHMMHDTVRPFTSSQQWWTGSEADLANAASTYLGYCGTYDWLDDRVVHHIEISLFPNWTRHDQLRMVTLTPDRLYLGERVPGHDLNVVLEWSRA